MEREWLFGEGMRFERGSNWDLGNHFIEEKTFAMNVVEVSALFFFSFFLVLVLFRFLSFFLFLSSN